MNKRLRGVTLLEVLLVLVIAATMMVMLIGYVQQRTDELRRTRVSLQIQQILNAGLAYYVSNGTWPDSIATLQTDGYLPPGTIKNPWGNNFIVYGAPGTGLFYVASNVVNSTVAQVITGRLPLAFMTDQAGATATPPTQSAGCNVSPFTGCNFVVSTVNIPGQNLNNATAVNYAGIYHSGACVPAPVCPVDKDGNTLVPQIMVVPVSVSGVYENPTSLPGTNCTDKYDYATCQKINLIPISGYSAKAYGDDHGAPVNYRKGAGTGIHNCTDTNSGLCYASSPTAPVEVEDGLYWRVCLQVNTEKGPIVPEDKSATGWAHGQALGSVLAITRCAIPNEPSGASFQIWQK